MKPWCVLNLKGKILVVACCLNLLVAVVLATEGKWSCIFSFIVAMFCGVCTYDKQYQHQDAKDINDGREQ
jgi:hypothetical protein